MTQNTFAPWDAIRATALWWSPILAGFLGAFGTHLLTQSREREKWILDNKKQEYRELLSALSDAYIVTISSTFEEIHNDKDGRKRFHDAQNYSLKIFRDRIFINDDLDLEELVTRWAEAIGSKAPNSRKKLHQEFDAIRDKIVAAANRAVPKTAWQRLMFWRD